MLEAKGEHTASSDILSTGKRMTPSEFRALIRSGESETLELKASFNKETIETLCAFANHRGGSVLVGVADSKKIAGAACDEEAIKNWANEIKQNTTPSIIPDISIIRIDGKNIVLIRVNEFPIKPVAFRDRYFKRIACSNHRMTLTEIAKLQSDDYQSRTRNKLIAEAFYLTRDIEKYGSGFIRVRNEIRTYPTMNFLCRESGDGFIVTLSYEQQKVSSSAVKPLMAE